MKTGRRSGQSEDFLARSSRAQSIRLRWKRRVIYLIATVLSFAILLLVLRPTFKVAEVKYAWVQILPDEGLDVPGGRLVRAIVAEGNRCPEIREGFRMVTMHSRPSPARVAFPIVLCEAELKATSSAQLGNWTLPIRPLEPNDIVVIGDTGCRMTYYDQKQSCLDKGEWPFGKNASVAATKVSTTHSFVLHLGDYHYREHPCADASPTCGGSPYGDNWETWEVEFFEPADPLLHAAPWIVMRGNHEDCDRAGAGWVFFFGFPGKKQTDAACDSTPTGYNVSIGKTEEEEPRSRILRVIDTSDERNPYAIEERCQQYRELIKPLENTGSEFWLAMHQPLWGRMLNGRKQDSKAARLPCELTKSAISSIREIFEKRPEDHLATLTIGGDTHAFQFFWPSIASTPVQITAGNGGTALDTLCELANIESTDKKCRDEDGNDRKYRLVSGKEQVADRNVRSFGIDGSSVTFAQHGFTVLRRSQTTWTATQFDTTGEAIMLCWFSEAHSRGLSPGCRSAS